MKVSEQHKSFANKKMRMYNKTLHLPSNGLVAVSSSQYQPEPASYTASVHFQGPLILVYQNEELVKQFAVKRKLGNGAQGNVYHVVHEETNTDFALKRVCAQDMEEMQQAKREVENCLKLNHPSVVKVHDIYEHISEEKEEYILYFTMDLYTLGDLSILISQYRFQKKFFSQEQIYQVLYDISDALSYIHSQKMAHRDLKPPNIFVATAEPTLKVVIGDFGLSKTIESVSKRHSFVGSLNTMAPEMYMREKYGFKVDIFSLGCIAYMMMTLCMTRNIAWELNGCGEKRTFDQLAKEIQNTRQSYHQTLVVVVTKMLSLHAERRPTANQIKKICYQVIHSQEIRTPENEGAQVRSPRLTISVGKKRDIQSCKEVSVTSPRGSKLSSSPKIGYYLTSPREPSTPGGTTYSSSPIIYETTDDVVLYVTPKKRTFLMDMIGYKEKAENTFHCLEDALQVVNYYVKAKSVTIYLSEGVFPICDNYHVLRPNIRFCGVENQTIVRGDKIVISQLGIMFSGIRFISKLQHPFILEIIDCDVIIQNCVVEGRICMTNCSKGTPIIKKNEICGNRKIFEVDSGSNQAEDAISLVSSIAHIVGNRVHNNSTNGIGVYAKSGGIISENTLSNHLKGQGIALYICEDTNIVVKSNTINGNFNAIYIANSRAILTDNTIHSNKKGVVINCSNVTMENNTLYLHEQVAIYVGNMGRIKLQGNTIRSNTMSLCISDSHAEVTQNSILENFKECPAVGICGAKTSFSLKLNEFCQNAGGVILMMDCCGVIENNTLTHNELYGVKTVNCQSKIFYNEIQSQKNGSCLILERAKTKSELRGNKIAFHMDCDSPAILIGHHSQAVEINLNSVENSLGAGVLVCYNSTVAKFLDNGFVGNLANIAVQVYRSQNCRILTSSTLELEQEAIGEEAAVIKYNVFLNNKDSVRISV